MPAKRELSMRQLRHLLRLHHDGVSAREIGRRLGVARSTIQDNLKRAAAAGLAWPLADGVTDEALERQLLGRAGVPQGQRRRVGPDWAALARELKRPGVTMTILWEEYREAHPEGYGYSRFCDLLRGFERRLTPVMRQHHVAGEKAFVDYSGKRVGIVDPSTGEIREAEIFVGVLGASNLTYAEATWTQTLPDWTGAHVRMFRFFGGAPKLLVPDNLKSGVNKASFYDPEINRTYGALIAKIAFDAICITRMTNVRVGVPFARSPSPERGRRTRPPACACETQYRQRTGRLYPEAWARFAAVWDRDLYQQASGLNCSVARGSRGAGRRPDRAIYHLAASNIDSSAMRAPAALAQIRCSRHARVLSLSVRDWILKYG